MHYKSTSLSSFHVFYHPVCALQCLTEDSVFKSNLEGWVELLVKVLASFGAERSKIHMLRLGYAKEAA